MVKNCSNVVLKLLLKVPKGKVTTYGELAKKARTSQRAVGQIMRNNKHPDVYPCYKVIRSNGTIGGFDGKTTGKRIQDKIMLLRKDGIEIENDKINLKKHLHMF